MPELLLPALLTGLTPVTLTEVDVPALVPRPPNLSAADVAEVRKNVEASDAENTKLAYTIAWTKFKAWCGTAGATPLPALPETVASYLSLVLRDDGTPYTVGSLSLHLSAIKRAHRERNLVPPTEHSLVVRTWKGIKRRRGTHQEGADALTADLLQKAIMALPHNARGVRDRAMLLLGFSGAFRRSELAAIRLCDVHFVTRGGEPWMRVEATRRKTSDDPIYVDVKCTNPTGKAVQRWLDMLALSGAPLSTAATPLSKVSRSSDGSALFRRVPKDKPTGWGLSDQSVRLVVKRATKNAGLPLGTYSAHSLRSGLATTMGENPEVKLTEIKQAGGWKSIATVDRYIQMRKTVGANLGLNKVLDML